MKLRLLDGSHQAMAYVGMLRGNTYVHEAMSDSTVVDLIERYMAEAAGTLPPVPGVDVTVYRAQLMERFNNPNIRDALERLATDASDPRPEVRGTGRAGALVERARVRRYPE